MAPYALLFSKTDFLKLHLQTVQTFAILAGASNADTRLYTLHGGDTDLGVCKLLFNSILQHNYSVIKLMNILCSRTKSTTRLRQKH